MVYVAFNLLLRQQWPSGLESACDPGDPGSIPRWCCLLLFP